MRFIKSVGELLGFGPAALLRLVVEPHVSQWALKLLPDQEKAKVFAASLRNTACPTGLAAGLKQNVIPQTASAVLDCRILPGQTIDTLLAEVQAVVGPDFRFEVLKSGFPYVIPSETPLFKVIERVLARRDPGCHVLPYLNVGFTDAHVFQRLGIKTYGFTPLKLPPDLNFSELVHSPNERIPVSGFLWGVRTFFETVREFCGAS